MLSLVIIIIIIICILIHPNEKILDEQKSNIGHNKSIEIGNNEENEREKKTCLCQRNCDNNKNKFQYI